MESSGYELSEVTKSLIDSYKNNHLQPPSWYSQEEREEFDQNVSDFEQSFKQMGVYIKK